MVDYKTYDDQLEAKLENLTKYDYENQTDKYQEFCNFQTDFIEEVKADHIARCEDKSEAIKDAMAEIFHDLLHESMSGNVCVSIPTREEAQELMDLIDPDLLLDFEIYQEFGAWTLDLMFGGYYCPEWDGWDQYL